MIVSSISVNLPAFERKLSARDHIAATGHGGSRRFTGGNYQLESPPFAGPSSPTASSMTAANDLAIRRALEAAGVEFIDENWRRPGRAASKAARSPRCPLDVEPSDVNESHPSAPKITR
jgi:hypothetical protein